MKVLLSVAFAMLALTGTASADSPFGGADGKINNDPEIRALVKDAKQRDLPAPAMLAGLTKAERDLVIDRGLTPTDEVITGTSDDLGPVGAQKARKAVKKIGARVAHAGSAAVTFWCERTSAAGITQMRLNSRWDWRWGDGHNIKEAGHYEWTSKIAPGWKNNGTRYLWPTGGLNTPRIGRAVEGRYSFEPFGTFLWGAGIIIDVIVYSDYRNWHSCSRS
jgi:hypothetical protein